MIGLAIDHGDQTLERLDRACLPWVSRHRLLDLVRPSIGIPDMIVVRPGDAAQFANVARSVAIGVDDKLAVLPRSLSSVLSQDLGSSLCKIGLRLDDEETLRLAFSQCRLAGGLGWKVIFEPYLEQPIDGGQRSGYVSRLLSECGDVIVGIKTDFGSEPYLERILTEHKPVWLRSGHMPFEQFLTCATQAISQGLAGVIAGWALWADLITNYDPETSRVAFKERLLRLRSCLEVPAD